MSRTLVVTNDFPPRHGGIESFVFSMASRMPPDSVVVYTSTTPGAAAFDASLPFPVIRDRRRMLVPTPRVSAAVCAQFRRHRCDSVLFGAAAPLGLLAGALRREGARRVVALTHGHELWWARVPGTRGLLRRIGDGCDVLTYLGEYTRSAIAKALSPDAAARMVRLPPGVDPARFYAGSGGADVRRRLGIDLDRPVVICVARMVERKGQDMLIRAMSTVLRDIPDALLLLVGDGPDRDRLQRLADAEGVAPSVRFAGAVPWEEVPIYVDAGNVFAMPCRTRKFGLEVEALGIVFLEASATGLPVVVGRSGGAPDACLEGETGFVVDPRSTEEIARRLVQLLGDPELAAMMGKRGRAWVEGDWQWDDLAARLRGLLS